MTLSIDVNEFLLQKSSLINTLWRAFQHTSSSMKSAYNTAQVSQPSMMDRISGEFFVCHNICKNWKLLTFFIFVNNLLQFEKFLVANNIG